MDKLPLHCQENGTLLKRKDYIAYESVMNGFKSSLKFNKVPDFYVINDRHYYAAEMHVDGLKVSTAALAGDDILNLKLYEAEGSHLVKNMNFQLPHEVNIQKVSVEVFNNNTILMRAPLKKKYS